jgi:predicted nucleotidyltransferase
VVGGQESQREGLILVSESRDLPRNFVSRVSAARERAIFQNMEAPPPTISPNATEGLTTMAATALSIFGDAARASYGDRLAKIVLFGSRARGDGRSGSDLDIAVVLRDLADKSADRNRLADLAYDAIVETSLDIQAVPVHSTNGTIRIITVTRHSSARSSAMARSSRSEMEDRRPKWRL